MLDTKLGIEVWRLQGRASLVINLFDGQSREASSKTAGTKGSPGSAAQGPTQCRSREFSNAQGCAITYCLVVAAWQYLSEPWSHDTCITFPFHPEFMATL